jgi:hypothetical protein
VYLDLDTGEVIHPTADVREPLQAIYPGLSEGPTDEEARKAAFASAIERCSLPGWMHDRLNEADAVEIVRLRFPASAGTRLFPARFFLPTGGHESLRGRHRAALNDRCQR